MALSKEEEEVAGIASSLSSSPLLGDYHLLASHPLSSATKTFANLFLVIVGVGILGLPYTFSNVGWALGILTLLMGGALSYHGMMLQLYSKRRLLKAHGELDLVIAGYGDLAFHVFGSWGRLFVDVLLTLGTFSGAIAHMAFIGQNFASIAVSVQTTHTQGMQVLQNSHSSSHMAFSTAVGLLNLTCPHGNMTSDPAGRVAHEKFTLPGYIHDNQSFFELGFENTSLLEPSHQDGSSLGANLSFSLWNVIRQYLARINWLSSTTYTWCIFSLVVAICAIPSMSLLAPVSTLGNALNLAALVALMVSDVLEIKRTSGLPKMKAFGDIVAVPSAFGVGVYAFQASGIVIPLEASMEQPSKFGSVMEKTFISIGVLYGTSAVLGYAAFGSNTQQVITLNLRSGIEAMLIKSAMSFTLFVAFPLVLTPVFELLERRFCRRKLSLVLRTLVVFVVCLLSTTVKQFTDFLSLSGSSISCLLGFIFPAAVHIKVMKDHGGKPPTILPYIADYLLIVFGLVFGACGTVFSVLKFF
eukprot:c9756_g1_i1 orf=196-1776(-)